MDNILAIETSTDICSVSIGNCQEAFSYHENIPKQHTEKLLSVINNLFEESKLSSDNLDLFFKNNKAIMYNSIKYLDGNTEANADEISFNLLNGDVKIKMFDKNKKIQIIKN